MLKINKNKIMSVFVTRKHSEQKFYCSEWKRQFYPTGITFVLGDAEKQTCSKFSHFSFLDLYSDVSHSLEIARKIKENVNDYTVKNPKDTMLLNYLYILQLPSYLRYDSLCNITYLKNIINRELYNYKIEIKHFPLSNVEIQNLQNKLASKYCEDNNNKTYWFNNDFPCVDTIGYIHLVSNNRFMITIKN